VPARKKSALSPRKQPRQQRSTKLVEAILEAAVRVLSRDGAAKFNTVRVAQRAGVSVGSLYQYFPNKQAILFRLQEEEWQQTATLLETILNDRTRTAPGRLRETMRAFFRTEHEEAPLRRALGEAAPHFRDSTVAAEHQRRSRQLLLATLAEAAPNLPRSQLSFAAELFAATMGALGKHVTDEDRSPADVERWAHASADMFLSHLATLNRAAR
jgi:AcrR family transcriptional regulator